LNIKDIAYANRVGGSITRATLRSKLAARNLPTEKGAEPDDTE